MIEFEKLHKKSILFRKRKLNIDGYLFGKVKIKRIKREGLALNFSDGSTFVNLSFKALTIK